MIWNFRKCFVTVLLLIVATTATVAAQVYANIPAGTSLQVRIIEKLSSETANLGDQFHGTLAAPVTVNGKKLFAKGTDVTGAVVNVERSGRLLVVGRRDRVVPPPLRRWVSARPCRWRAAPSP